MIIVDEKSFTIGGNVCLTDFMETLDKASSKYDFYGYAKFMASHIDLVAHVPVRNVRKQFLAIR